MLGLLNLQIAVILDMERAMKEIDALAWEKREIRKLDGLIAAQEERIRRSNELKVSAYEDFREGMIDRILLLPNREIRVELRQQDQLRQAADFLASHGTAISASVREVI